MSTTKYHKLVRDRIPEIIMQSGKRPVYSILSEEAYLAKLDEKLNEELAEYQERKSMEELADLLEVIRAVAVAWAVPWKKWNPPAKTRQQSAEDLRRRYGRKV